MARRSWKTAVRFAFASCTLFVLGAANAAPYIYTADQHSPNNGVIVFDAATGLVRDTIGVGSFPADAVLSPDGRRLFVPNAGDDTVSIVDTTIDAVVATVATGYEPFLAVVSPDGSRAWVLGNDNSISVIDIDQAVVIHTIPSITGGSGVVTGLAISADSSELYAVTYVPYELAVYDTMDYSFKTSVTFPASPDGRVAASPDGKRIYVDSVMCGCLFTVDAHSHTLLATTLLFGSVGGWTGGPVAVTPDSSKIYVGQRAGNKVAVVDAVTDLLITTIPAYYPGGIAFSGSGAVGYVVQNDFQSTKPILSFSTQTDTLLGSINIPGYSTSVSQSGFVGFPAPTAFVANSAGTSISALDTAKKTLADVKVGSGPDGIAVSAGSRSVYVSNSSDGTVSVRSGPAYQDKADIPVGSKPVGLALNSEGSTLYVANFGDDTVSVVDTTTRTVSATVSLEQQAKPIALAVAPDGATVYVSQAVRPWIALISTATNLQAAPIYVGAETNGIAVAHDGASLFVTTFDGVRQIDVASGTVENKFSVGLGATLPDEVSGVAVTPDGSRCFAANTAVDSVSVIDLNTGHTSAIEVGGSPTGVSITPDARFLYVANKSGNSVSVIDTSSNQVVSTLPGFNSPSAIGNFVEPFPNKIFAGGFD